MTSIITAWDAKKRKRLFSYLVDQTFTIAGRKYTVPAGYWFDGATVPGLLEGLFSPTGITFFAASLHDFLYDTRGRGLHGEYSLSRKEVDEIFYLHMLQDETPRAQARLMWLGVRTPVGQGFWDRDSFPHYLKVPQ